MVIIKSVEEDHRGKLVDRVADVQDQTEGTITRCGAFSAAPKRRQEVAQIRGKYS